MMGHYGGEHVKAIMHAAENWPRVRGKGSDMQIWAFPEYRADPENPQRGDHAGAYETSLMMYLRPELVDLSELPSEGEVVGTDAGFGIGGEDPRKATAELGQQIAEAIVQAIVKGVQERLR